MTHKTKGIVLRSVKYGETSLIVTIFTELFGVQSYLVNGVRVSKKGSASASYFQPCSILDLISYHNELKNLQRLKEYKWSYLYQHIFSDVMKNAVAVFMIELLTKSVKQPEAHPDLFHFAEDALLHLDDAGETVTANFPLFYAVHLAVFFGFRISDEFSVARRYLDLQEGTFTEHYPDHPYYLQDADAEIVSDVLKVMHPSELQHLPLNRESRRRIISAMETFYALHVPEFGAMKTLPVLREIMN